MVDINGERNRRTFISYESSLDISTVLDYCRRQEFIIQTVVNDLYHSQNTSYSTNPTSRQLSVFQANYCMEYPSAPVIFGATLLLVEDNYAVVQVRKSIAGQNWNVVFNLSRCYSIWMRDSVSLSSTSSLMVWLTSSSMSPVLTERQER